MTIRAAALALSAILGVGVMQADGRTKPRPIRSVGPRLDAARSAESVLTATAGGSVSADSRSGARLTLRIPAGGLADDTKVRVTPLSSIARLPRGARLLAGAQFAPEGTPVGGGATLTIESGRLRSAKHLHALVWSGQGSYVSLWRGTRSGGTFKLPVAHFSGVAIYDGSRSGLLDPGGTSQPYYEQVVRPKLRQALTNDALAQEAIQLWVDWERGMQLAGVGEDYLAPQRAEAASLITRVVHNALDQAFDRCVRQHDVLHELPKMIAIGRIAALADPDSSMLDEAFEKARKCARFELDFETVLTLVSAGSKQEGNDNVAWNTTQVTHVSVRGVPLVPTTGAIDSGLPPVVRPFDVSEFSFDDYRHSEARSGDTTTCTSTGRVAAPVQPFQVSRLELSGTETPVLALEMLPGDLQSIANGSCSWTVLYGGSGSYPLSTPLTGLLQFPFATLHAAEWRGAGFLIEGWTYLRGSTWARKTYERTIQTTDTSTLTERTTFELRHTPQS